MTTKNILVRKVPKDLKDKFKGECAQAGKSMQEVILQYIRHVVRQGVRRKRK